MVFINFVSTGKNMYLLLKKKLLKSIKFLQHFIEIKTDFILTNKNKPI